MTPFINDNLPPPPLIETAPRTTPTAPRPADDAGQSFDDQLQRASRPPEPPRAEPSPQTNTSAAAGAQSTTSDPPARAACPAPDEGSPGGEASANQSPTDNAADQKAATAADDEVVVSHENTEPSLRAKLPTVIDVATPSKPRGHDAERHVADGKKAATSRGRKGAKEVTAKPREGEAAAKGGADQAANKLAAKEATKPDAPVASIAPVAAVENVVAVEPSTATEAAAVAATVTSTSVPSETTPADHERKPSRAKPVAAAPVVATPEPAPLTELPTAPTPPAAESALTDSLAPTGRGERAKSRGESAELAVDVAAKSSTDPNKAEPLDAGVALTRTDEVVTTPSSPPVAGAEASDRASDREKPGPIAGAPLAQRTGEVESSANRGQEASGGQLSSADRVRFVQRVARAFHTAAERGGAVRLRLSPPELGSLQLEVAVRNGELVARLEAETQSARQLLNDSLPVLRERLAQMDIKVARFDVDLMDQHSGGASQQPAGEPGGQPHENRPPRPHLLERNGQRETTAAPRSGSRPLADGRLNVIV